MDIWKYLVFAVLAGGAALFGWQLVNPPQPTGRSMTPPDTSALEPGAPIAQVTLPAELSANAQLGEKIFNAKCAVCHGQNAAGQNGVAPPLVHRTYEPAHHGDGAFLMAAQNGVQSHHWAFGNMPPIEGLTPGDVKFVVQYIRALQQANGIN